MESLFVGPLLELMVAVAVLRAVEELADGAGATEDTLHPEQHLLALFYWLGCLRVVAYLPELAPVRVLLVSASI